MKIKLVSLAIVFAVTGIVAGCKTKNIPVPETVETVTAPAPQDLSGGIRKLPRAVAYKTNGNWDKNVAVKWNKNDSTLVYYPDPYDVNADTEPMKLTDGWLLDRQGGIADNTAFLRWTMEEYHALPVAPSPEEIIANIIPEAKVTEIMILPMTNMEAQRDPSAAIDLIRKAQP